MFILGLGVPAYSQFVFVEYCYSRHPDVFCMDFRPYSLHSLGHKSIENTFSILFTTLARSTVTYVKVPNRAVAMDAWARLACYPQGNLYRVISGRI